MNIVITFLVRGIKSSTFILTEHTAWMGKQRFSQDFWLKASREHNGLGRLVLGLTCVLVISGPCEKSHLVLLLACLLVFIYLFHNLVWVAQSV
jgi:hypothetical protein